MTKELDNAPLGKTSAYVDRYDKSLLFPISRELKREEIGIESDNLPFKGWDLWTAYEISWLNLKGKPQIAVATIQIPAKSPNLIESKSFKLYLNSFNNTPFETAEQVKEIMEQDLSEAARDVVNVRFHSEDELRACGIATLNGESLDELDVACQGLTLSKELLSLEGQSIVSEVLTSDLLKSNCLVTGQPDWGSLQISYTGAKLNRASLLKYIVSFRNHNEFHEQCVERIFKDLLDVIHPEKLTVYARYTRRGGLDINPIRSLDLVASVMENNRLFRQ